MRQRQAITLTGSTLLPKIATSPGGMPEMPTLITPLLDQVHTPADLRQLHPNQLRQLADELRQEVISAVGVTCGHLGSGLGVVELTTAIHYVFNTPHDRLIWDVGHQCYPHKILTGRRDRIRTLRQGGGLSGRSEEHTSALQSLMRISYAVFCLKKKKKQNVKLNIYVVHKT